MFYFLLTVFLTLAISALCSMIEAMVLSTTAAEIEALKKSRKKLGLMLENFIKNIGQTSSAILALNTIANTFGATTAGILYANMFPSSGLYSYIFPAAMTLSILVLSEILPKNFGIIYRKSVQVPLIPVLGVICIVMKPISATLSKIVSLFAKNGNVSKTGDSEIILLAEKGAKEGVISIQERNLVSNALTLDDVAVSEIMTPRTVVLSFGKNESIGKIFRENSDIAFSRIPVYDKWRDNIVGIVRRRDIMLAKAKDQDSHLVGEFMSQPLFVPENGSALSVLRQLIRAHSRLAIAVDEFGAFSGVITLEDIFEKLVGSEIFEKDDIAVDMRELAREKSGRKK